MKKSSGGSSKASGKASKKVSFKNSQAGGKPPFAIPSSKSGCGKGENKVTLSEVELKLEADLPKNVKILMDCEAGSILEGIQDYLQMLSDDPKIKIPESFAKALGYTQSTSQRYSNPQEVKKALQKLKNVGVTDAEIGMISNVGPETDDEVYALVPSLKGNEGENKGPIREALSELAKMKQPKFQDNI